MTLQSGAESMDFSVNDAVHSFTREKMKWNPFSQRTQKLKGDGLILTLKGNNLKHLDNNTGKYLCDLRLRYIVLHKTDEELVTRK